MSSNEKEFVREVYKRAFGAIAGFPGWLVEENMWAFLPATPAPFTRDEAFKNVCKRSKRWKR